MAQNPEQWTVRARSRDGAPLAETTLNWTGDSGVQEVETRRSLSREGWEEYRRLLAERLAKERL